jgi:sporulation protein YlmC with PRC-barrel domain
VPQQPTHNYELQKLSETNLILADASQDIRNRRVIDRHGKEIGHIDDLFVDQDERMVRMLQIKAGGFLGVGERHFLLPVDTITSISNIDSSKVHVNVTLERVIGSPIYNPQLVIDPAPQVFGQYYGYYGIPPYWGAGYLYPSLWMPPINAAAPQ